MIGMQLIEVTYPSVTSRFMGFGEKETSIVLKGKLWFSKGLRETQDVPLLLFVHQYSILGGCGHLLEELAVSCLKRAHAPLTAITFNMRGVQGSTGSATYTGKKEIEDVKQMCKYAVETLGVKEIVLIGSSAGATIAGSALNCMSEVKAYVGIGYTFGRLASILFGSHFTSILQCEKPRLFIMGSSDGFTSTSQLTSYLLNAKGHTEKYIIPHVGHFEIETGKFDEELSERIMTFLVKHSLLPPIVEAMSFTDKPED